MTVATTNSRRIVDGNGVSQTFATDFEFFDDNDLRVTYVERNSALEVIDSTVLTLGSDYTVSGGADTSGPISDPSGRTGEVTLLAITPGSNDQIILERIEQATQDLDLEENDPLPAQALENALDKLTYLVQQTLTAAEGTLQRTIRIPVGDPLTELSELPAPSQRSGRFVTFTATGDLAVGNPDVEVTQRIFDTNTDVEAAQIEAGVTTLIVNRYLPLAEGGGGVYGSSAGEPSHDGKLQSADGKWWELISPMPSPLTFGAKGDASADDTAAFTALETFAQGREIDLLGRTYSVSAIPTGNRYTNGWWLVPNADESAPVRYPAYDTIEGHRLKIETSRRYSAWPQDTACAYNGAVLIGYNEGTDHLSSDLHHVIATSLDNGQSVFQFERGMTGFMAGAGARMCFSAGVLDGQEFRIVRQNTGDAASGGVHRLYGRRRFEVDEVDSLELTPGTDKITVAYANHGVKIGDEVTFAEWDGGAVGGVDPAGNTYDVESVTATGFTLTVSGASGSTAVTDRGKLQFEQGTFANIDVDGGSLGAAIVASSGDISSSPTLIHSMAPVPGTTGAFYVGLHGGGAAGPFIAKITGALTATPTVAWVRRVQTALTQGVEPTVAYDPASGDILGFVRSQSDSYPLRFWRSDDDLATDATVADCPWGDAFANYSPVPLRIADGTVHAALTGNRVRDGKQGKVPLYWLRVPLADADGGVWADAELIKLRDLYFSNTNTGDTSNAVGVPSLVADADGGWLHFFYSTETPAQDGDFDGQPHVESMSLRLQTSTKTQPFSGEMLPQFTERTEEVYANRVRGAGGFRFSGTFSASAATRISNGLAATRPSDGAYDFTFQDDHGNAIDLGNTDYVVLVTLETDGTPLDGYTCIVEDKAGTGFGVRVRNDGGSVQNLPLSVGVIVYEDTVREGWN